MNNSQLRTILCSTLIACTALLPLCTQAKNLIFDLNGTVLQVKRGGYFWHVGPLSLISYFVSGGSKERLKAVPFAVIAQTPLPIADFETWKNGSSVPYLPDGQVMPDLMCAWQAGLITSEECTTLVLNTAKKLWCAGQLFKNKREYEIVKKIIRAVFNPALLSYQAQPLPGAIQLLRECNRTGEHTLYALSNWDAQSGIELLLAPHMQELWNCIPREHVVMSGAVGMIKPHRNFFEYICARYKLDPADCIFVDDQIENIKAAEDCGMAAIHIKNLDYVAVRKELVARGVL